ncbi:hypothetical protein QJQ45_024859, partial [Haematococcus lacustris]
WWTRHAMCQHCVRAMRGEDHGICLGVQHSVGPMLVMMFSMVVGPVQPRLMRPHEAPRSMLYSTCQASPSLCANGAPSVTQLIMCHSSPSFNMFTISTRTRTAFLAEALRCLRDVLPWLVVLLAVCVETFYAPESPALVALYLSACISVRTTLDIPQGATTPSKAPCHQCTQPAATLDVNCDATCPTVTAPWLAQGKEGVCTWDEWWTRHAMCQHCVRAMRGEDHGICLGVQHSVGPMLVMMFSMVVGPVQPRLMRPHEAPRSVGHDVAQGCACRLAQGKEGVCTWDEWWTRHAMCQHCVRAMRGEDHGICLGVQHSVGPMLVMMFSMVVGPVQPRLMRPHEAPRSMLYSTCQASPSLCANGAPSVTQLIMCHSSPSFNMFTISTRTRTAFLAEALRCLRDVLPWLVVLLAVCVETFYAPESPALVALYLSACISVRTTLDIPQGATTPSKAPCHQCTQPAATLDVNCDATCPTVTAPWLAQGKEGVCTWDEWWTRHAMCQHCVRAMRGEDHGICLGVQHSVGPMLVMMFSMVVGPVQPRLMRPHEAPRSMLYSTCQASPSLCANGAPSVTQLIMCHSSPSFNMFTISTRTRTAFLAEALRCLRDVLPWLVVLLAVCVETFYAPESPALVALYLSACISVRTTLDIPQGATTPSKAPCHQCTQPAATLDVNCDATCPTVTAPWLAQGKEGVCTWDEWWTRHAMCQHCVRAMRGEDHGICLGVQHSVGPMLVMMFSMVVGPVQPRLMRPHEAPRSMLYSTCQASPSLCANGAPSVTQLIMCHSSPSFNMFTISTRTRTAFLAEALRCLRDVLPWLVVLLAVCVETFYAPESPALVALYLSACISVRTTLDIPQGATTPSKAPCHQCTQPAATLDVNCDATCPTVTAPWLAQGKEGVCTWDEWWTRHAMCQHCVRAMRGEDHGICLGVQHSVGPMLVMMFSMVVGPVQPRLMRPHEAPRSMLYSTCQASPSLCANGAPSVTQLIMCHSSPSFNMFTISTRTRTAFLAEALRCLRDVLPWLVVLLAVCVETFYAPESPALVALYLSACISVRTTLDIPQGATTPSKAPCHQCTQPAATLDVNCDATCPTVTAPWLAQGKEGVCTWDEWWTRHAMCQHCVRAMRGEDHGICLGVQHSVGPMLVMMFSMVVGPVQPRLMRPHEAPRSMLYSTCQASPSLCANGAPSVTQLIMCHSSPSFNMFTISTRTRTAFLAEALRCLRDVLPWLVVLLAVCVETFYAPESPALVALYLSACISVRTTLDIPQGATTPSKAPCHQCTQPAATLDVNCDATCPTVTAPWLAQGKEGVCTWDEWWTRHAMCQHCVRAMRGEDHGICLGVQHSVGPMLVMMFSMVVGPVQPRLMRPHEAPRSMLYSTCQASPSLCANGAPSVTQLIMCHSSPSFNMFTISTRTRTAFLAEALRCLRDVLPWLVVLLAVCVETFYAPESPALVALYLSACISVRTTLDIPQGATTPSKAPCHQCTQPAATLDVNCDATCPTVTAPCPSFNMFTISTRTRTAFLAEALRCLRDVLPWLVVLLAVCVETFYAPESPALVALYLSACISVRTTLDIPQGATTPSKAPCHQCTQPAATLDVNCDATCPTVTAPWLAQGKEGVCTWDEWWTRHAMCQHCVRAMRGEDHGICLGVQHSVGPMLVMMFSMVVGPVQPRLMRPHEAPRSMLYSTCQASPSLCANGAPSVTQLIMCHSSPSFNMFTISTRTRTAFLAEALRCLRDVLPWLVVLLAVCVETFYAPESPALVALYLSACISVRTTLDIPQGATTPSKAPCHQCTQPAATLDVNCDATCPTVTAPWLAQGKEGVCTWDEWWTRHAMCQHCVRAMRGEDHGICLGVQHSVGPMLVMMFSMVVGPVQPRLMRPHEAPRLTVEQGNVAVSGRCASKQLPLSGLGAIDLQCDQGRRLRSIESLNAHREEDYEPGEHILQAGNMSGQSGAASLLLVCCHDAHVRAAQHREVRAVPASGPQLERERLAARAAKAAAAEARRCLNAHREEDYEPGEHILQAGNMSGQSGAASLLLVCCHDAHVRAAQHREVRAVPASGPQLERERLAARAAKAAAAEARRCLNAHREEDYEPGEHILQAGNMSGQRSQEPAYRSSAPPGGPPQQVQQPQQADQQHTIDSRIACTDLLAQGKEGVCTWDEWWTRHAMCQHCVRAMRGEDHGICLGVQHSVGPMLVMMFSMVVGPVQPRLMRPHEAPRSMLYSTCQASPSLCANGAPSVTQLIMCHSSPSFNMFTISTRTRTAFLAEALRCLRDVLPWLVVLLAVCVETFYAPESPALVALYLSACISVRTTLDIPQGATTPSKAPCHQCTQPAATLDVNCDATCPTVTAPWLAQGKEGVCTWDEWWTRHAMCQHCVRAMRGEDHGICLGVQHSVGPMLVMMFSMVVGPVQPRLMRPHEAPRSMLYSTCQASPSLCANGAPSVTQLIMCHSSPSFNMFTISTRTRTAFLAEALRCLRDVLPWLVVLLAVCVETFYAPESPALVALYLSACISVRTTLDIPQGATTPSKAPCHQCTQPAATLDVNCDATCPTVTAPCPSFNMFTISTRTRTAFLAEALRCLRDVLPWLVVLLAVCVETFYAPESPALVALYLSACISVRTTLDIPQGATTPSKAPCHQCTQPAATLDVNCDATCPTVTAPWLAQGKEGVCTWDEWWTRHAMCQHCVCHGLRPMRGEDHGICLGVQHSVGPMLVMMFPMVVGPVQPGLMRPHEAPQSLNQWCDEIEDISHHTMDIGRTASSSAVQMMRHALCIGQSVRLPGLRLAWSRPISANTLAAAATEAATGEKPQGKPPGKKGGKRGKAKSDEGGEQGAPSPYSSTISLPVTPFSLRANSVVREPQIQAMWEQQQVYKKLLDSNPGPAFTLHDGPPYANGDLHIGHALNKVLKDIINRYQLLRGRKARFVPGWDTHGLPIELKVLQSLPESERRSIGVTELRTKAREYALKAIDAQRNQFKRYGIWGDWSAPYITLQPGYEAAQLSVFGRMFLNGHIYRGRKPVHWSPSSRTALAEAELEYPEGHKSRSIYVAMPMEAVGPNVDPEDAQHLKGAAFAIWTTTPWTIPANLAVAVNGQLEYSLVAVQGEDAAGWSCKKLVVASDLVPKLQDKLGVQLLVLARLPGASLEGCTYRHPLFERVSPLVLGGDYITTDTGTGLVHTAPGHGQEDYQVGLRCGLPLLSPVDDAGCFTHEAGPRFAGKSVQFRQFEVGETSSTLASAVQGDGNAEVVTALAEVGALLLEEQYAHKYPYDWRTKKPTIFRATSQWFASVDGFKAQSLEAIRQVRPMTSDSPAFSLQCMTQSNEPLMTEETISHVTQLVAQQGSDCWWTLPIEALLPPSLAHLAPSLRKGEDTMDVWFDSGSSWAGVLQTTPGLTFPADLYLEGSDQHRGWFQSSLLTSVAANGQAPYKQVLTHGFALDEKGAKMSKSLGNVVDPRIVIEGGKDERKDPPYGADVLRMWVASVDFTSDVMIGPGILKQVADLYRKMRGTLRFILGNLNDFDPQVHSVAYPQLPSLDRYMLHRLALLQAEATSAYDSYAFGRVSTALQYFVVKELSTFYLDIAKDRLYIQALDHPARRSCQTVLWSLLRGLLACLAPIAPHMADDAWQAAPQALQAGRLSVFQGGWAQSEPQWSEGLGADEARTWAALRTIRDAVNMTMEKARSAGSIGASLDARVLLHVADPGLTRALAALDATGNNVDELRTLFIVSQAELVADAATAKLASFTDVLPASAPSSSASTGNATGTSFAAAAAVEAGVPADVTIGVSKAEGAKCARCWNYSTQVGSVAPGVTDLCERCHPIMVQMGFSAQPNAAMSTGAAEKQAVVV